MDIPLDAVSSSKQKALNIKEDWQSFLKLDYLSCNKQTNNLKPVYSFQWFLWMSPLKAVSGSKQKAAKTTGKLLKASLDSLLLGHTRKKLR
jgi:hypothetical protein